MSRIIGEDLKETIKSAGEDEVKTVFSAFTALSIFLFKKIGILFFPFQNERPERERERSILFGPFRLCDWFTPSVLFVFSFKIQFSDFGFILYINCRKFYVFLVYRFNL